MKKTMKLTSLILALSIFALSMFSCGKKEVEENTPPTESTNTTEVGNQSSNKLMKLVIGGSEEKIYSVDFSGIEINEGVMSIIKYLAANHGLNYKESGGMLSEIGGLKSEGSTYIFLWTSVEADFDLSEWASTKTWNGVNLTTAGVGVADMTVEHGAVIYVGTIKY